jgi:hypothetical protein
MGMTSTALDDSRRAVLAELRSAGYALLPPALGAAALGLDLGALAALAESWDRLPRDPYLRDGGHYRARRHSCFTYTVAGGVLAPVARRPHWQPTTYNALHGGLLRWFEPIETGLAGAAAFRQLLAALGALFAQLQPVERWYIEAHQFRIDTQGGIGRPTPEGAHRDGVDFVAVVLVRRGAVRGGETRVFQAHGNQGIRFIMEQPGSTLLLDDARVIHETTPIQAEDTAGSPTGVPAASAATVSVRDTLVLTYRAQGFQEPAGGA